MIAAALAGALFAAALVGGYRHVALRRRWLDHPNERSSHRAVVPRGAGIVFALLITAGLLFCGFDRPAFALSALATFAVALIGWYDDLRNLRARYRLLLYVLCAACTGFIVYAPDIAAAASRPLAFAAISALLVLGLAWLINLYNFMDGINGIAGFEAVFVLGAILWLGSGSAFTAQLGPSLWLALGAVAGFLLWNFPTARVFMGDAGSAYLGALLGFFLLWSIRLQGPSLFSWLILLGVFVTDTMYTLAVRVATRQRWYLAHRLHAYQRLCDKLQSHARTVLLLGAINLLWLLPCAWLARGGGALGFAILIAAYIPLLYGCHCLKAGIPQRGTV